MEETVCLYCGKVIPMNALDCPYCGSRNPLAQLQIDSAERSIKNVEWIIDDPRAGFISKAKAKKLKREAEKTLRKYGVKKGGGGCYIATSVYGSYDCPQVWTLRRFRDYTLDKTWYGRLFIKCYYAVSPTVVRLFGSKKSFRAFWRIILDKMVSKLNDKGIKNTRYHDKY